MELFSANTSVDFLGKRNIAFFVSTLLIMSSFYVWFSKGQQKYGIDFLGGHEVVVKLEEDSDVEGLVAILEKAGLRGASVQSFEAGSHEYSIRVGLLEGVDSKMTGEKIRQALKDKYGEKFQVIKTDSVGATIGEEIRKKALTAVILGLIGILAYVAFRFEFSFALGAVVALFHDVVVSTGAYLLFGHVLNASCLAAALTIVGYSVNDTIVIFDRVREEMRKRKDYDLATLMNESMNYCLSRTIITSLLTFFSALALLVWGGGAIQDLSLFLVAGLISGTYSTIYIAAPVVLWWEGRRRPK